MRRNIPAGGRRQAERLGWAGAGGRRATSRATAAAPGGPQPSGAKGFTARNLRIALFTDQGVMVADPVRLGALPKDERGWIPVSAALSRFEGARGASTVRAVGIFADDSEVFYLGQVRMVVDRTPVHATLKAEPSITNVDRVIDFSVELRGGPIDPEVSWDFDKSDGVQRQAVGANVKYIYKKAGDYQVTCTVTDRSGAREPMVATTGIHIEGS